MKNGLRKLLAAVSLAMLSGLSLQVRASHFQGSELTYTCIAPLVYVADLKIYRDCTGAAAPNNASLLLSSNGCNNGRSVPMVKVGANTIGNLYCPQLGAPTCTSNGNPNYEEVIFSATITFTAAEAQCQNWIMSWAECCRPMSANLRNASNYSFYAEAYLNLGTPANPIYNSSPKFKSIVVPYINKMQPILLSSNATDKDGDSLVYSLTAPLDRQFVTIPYDSFTVKSGVVLNPQNPFQGAPIPTIPYIYTPTFPMPSYSIDWSLPNPIPTPSFILDPTNGSLSLNPILYYPNTPSFMGLNKYVVVVRVDDYRKINGAVVKVGSVRRDMFITVIDCGINQNPMISAPIANNQPLAENTIINLRPGTPLNLVCSSNDFNANDILQMDSDVANILPGATFTKTNTNHPNGTISWIPTASHVRNQVYYFHISVQDNACPVKGQQVKTFGVRVSNTGGVTGISDVAQNQPAFTAYPNPFASEITFKVKQTQANQQIIIYNVLGQQVDRISLNGRMNAEQEVTWKNAGKFPAGQYVARFNNEFGQSLKINKLK